MSTIVQDGDSVLRSMALPVDEEQFGTMELMQHIEHMAAALDAQTDGVAIAAPQVGISLRIFLVRYDRLLPLPPGESVPPADLGVYINPELVRVSRRREVMDEGCLSVRGTYGKTYRHERATVWAYTPDGRSFERGGGGILAQAFQHEIDHLDGILFTDHAIEIRHLEHETAAHE